MIYSRISYQIHDDFKPISGSSSDTNVNVTGMSKTLVVRFRRISKLWRGESCDRRRKRKTEMGVGEIAGEGGAVHQWIPPVGLGQI